MWGTPFSGLYRETLLERGVSLFHILFNKDFKIFWKKGMKGKQVLFIRYRQARGPIIIKIHKGQRFDPPHIKLY